MDRRESEPRDPEPRASLRGAASGPVRLNPVQSAVKIVFDKVVATGMLVVLAPVLLGCAILSATASGGPVLVTLTRIGRRGATFELLNFKIPADLRLGGVMEKYGIHHLPS